MQINGPQQQQLRDALVSAFPTHEDLEMMVLYGLDERLSAIVKSENLQFTAFKLIEWAMARGSKLEKLVTAALEHNPDNPKLRRVAQQLGLSSDAHATPSFAMGETKIEQAPQAPSSPKATLVPPQDNPSHQQILLRPDASTYTQAVGRIMVPQIVRRRVIQRFPQGTGWLIASGLAITCCHVFRAREGMDTLHEHDLHAQVTNSFMIFDLAQADKSVKYKIDKLECYDEGLNYALLCLQDCQQSPLSERGFLKLADGDQPLTPHTELSLFQHSNKDQPQQSTSGHFVRYVSERQESMFYNASTEKGACGAPVLSLASWEVVALHTSEQETDDLAQATLLKAILLHIQQIRPNLYHKIINAH